MQNRKKSICEHTTQGASTAAGDHSGFLSATHRKLLQATVGTDSPNLDSRRWKNVSGLMNLDRVRQWCKQHESMFPSCLVSIVQAAAAGLGNLFLAHIKPLNVS